MGQHYYIINNLTAGFKVKKRKTRNTAVHSYTVWSVVAK